MATEIDGTVIEVLDRGVRISVTGDMLPNTGEPLTIYFEIPGVDIVAEVAKGTVRDFVGNVVIASLIQIMANWPEVSW